LLNPDIDISQPVAVLTFDDGLKDFYNYVFPVLKRWKVPATVYCSTAPLINASLLNMHRIHLLLGALGQKEFRRRFEGLHDRYNNSYKLETSSASAFNKLYPRDDEDTRKFKKLLNFQLPHSVLSPILKSLFKEVYGPEKEIVERFYMTLDEIKVIKNEGFDIGIHTHNHHILSYLDIHQQKYEITTAVDYLREQINLETIHVAYPYGIPGTWNNNTMKLMKNLGYQAGLTLGRRIVKPDDLCYRWGIPRYDVNDIFDRENNLNAKVIGFLYEAIDDVK
jgi:peptidoglycan/xylan/chitin deacetylase (PgdA/CDA1 family)